MNEELMNQELQPPKTVFLPVIIAVIITAIVATALAVSVTYFFLQKGSVSPSETENITGEKMIPTSQTKKSATVLPKDYIVTEGAAFVQGGGRQKTHFSVYKTDGTLVRKIDMPSDAARSAAGSDGVFGNKIYYLSGSEDITSIAEIDPLSCGHHVFAFTETKSTNTGNVLFAIIAWAVSQDNEIIAWVDTEGTLHVADRDGLSQKSYPMQGSDFVGRARVEFSKDSSSLYVWIQGANSLKKLDLSEETFTTLITSENGDFTISPSGQYIAYSNFSTPLAIRELVSGQETPITLPETYDNGHYFHSFSSDESMLHFRATRIGDKIIDYYSVQTDGTNLSKTEDTRMQSTLVFLSDNFVIARCGEGTCLVDVTSTKQPAMISDEWFLGSFK